MEVFLGILASIVYISLCFYVASMSTSKNVTGFWGIFFISWMLTPIAGLIFVLRQGKEIRQLTVPITIVDHEEDGSWKFFSSNYLTRINITSIGEAIENDSSMKEIGDLPLGFSAERKTSKSKWKIYKKGK